MALGREREQMEFTSEKLKEAKEALLAHYQKFYANEYDQLWTFEAQALKEGKLVPMEAKFDSDLLEQTLQNPEILRYYHTIATMSGELGFDLPYPIEVANNLGLKEMVCYLKETGHFTPYVQPRLLCDAIRKKNMELVNFYINAGISPNICDVNRYKNIVSNVSRLKNGEKRLDKNPADLGCYTNHEEYQCLRDGYYALPPKDEPVCHALVYAINSGSFEITEFLLKSGASLNMLSPAEWITPTKDISLLLETYLDLYIKQNESGKAITQSQITPDNKALKSSQEVIQGNKSIMWKSPQHTRKVECSSPDLSSTRTNKFGK